MSFFYFGDDTAVDDTRAGIAVLVVGGEIDYAASPQLKERIAGCFKSGARRLVLDLSSTTFIDSMAIGVLVGAVFRQQERGDGRVAIVCTNSNVLKIFELTGLDSMVALHSSREEALLALVVAG